MKYAFFQSFWFLAFSAGVFFSPLFGEQPAPVPGAPRFAEGVDLFYQGDAEAAYQVFDAAQKADPSLPPAGVTVALLSRQKGDLPQTHLYLARAIKENPADPEAWYRLGEIAADEKRLTELELLRERADSLLNAFAESDAGKASPRLSFLRSESISLAARGLEEAGDLAASEAKMREYIKLNPENAEGYLSLGYLLLRQDKNDEALEVFSLAKERNPSLFAGWLTAAVLFEEKGNAEEASRLLDQHRSDGQLAVFELSRIARMLYRRGRLDEAREAAERIPAKTLDRLRWDGLFAYSEGDAEKAAAAYREALRNAPNDFDVMNGLILALAEQGKTSSLTEAFEKADRFRRSHPQSDEAAGTLAWVEFCRGNADRAEDMLLPILYRGGLTPTSAVYLACAAFSRKENDLARQLLVSALAEPAFFPKRSEAEKLLKSLTDNTGETEMPEK